MKLFWRKLLVNTVYTSSASVSLMSATVKGGPGLYMCCINELISYRTNRISEYHILRWIMSLSSLQRAICSNDGGGKWTIKSRMGSNYGQRFIFDCIFIPQPSQSTMSSNLLDSPSCRRVDVHVRGINLPDAVQLYTNFLTVYQLCRCTSLQTDMTIAFQYFVI